MTSNLLNGDKLNAVVRLHVLTCAPRKSCIAAILSLTPAKLAFIEGYSLSEYISTLLDSFMPFSCRDCNPPLKAVKSLRSVLKFLSERLILSVITFSSWSLKCNDIQVQSVNVYTLYRSTCYRVDKLGD